MKATLLLLKKWDPCRWDQSQAVLLLHITTKGRPRHMHWILLVDMLPWEPPEKGNTSLSWQLNPSQLKQLREIADVGLAILSALFPTQKLPVFLALIWRRSSYLLPWMAPYHCAKMRHTPSHPHQRSFLSFPAFSQFQAPPPQNKLSEVFQINGF